LYSIYNEKAKDNKNESKAKPLHLKSFIRLICLVPESHFSKQLSGKLGYLHTCKILREQAQIALFPIVLQENNL
jgi:hypothetical protein